VLLVDARVRHEQIDLACLCDRALDGAEVGDVHLHPLAGDLVRNRLHLLAAARADDNIPAVAG